MSWQCVSCGFKENENESSMCVACGTERSRKTSNSKDGNNLVEIELPPKEKLGVKLLAPRDGVVHIGIAVEHIQNPLLENKVHEGDLIVAVGGKNVDGLGFSEAIDLIRTMPRPLLLTFKVRNSIKIATRESSESEHDIASHLITYAVVFDEGPMGLNLEEAIRYGIDGAIVKALKGPALESGMISIGDIVAKVNETSVLCLPYNEVMETLRNASVPRTLQFVPKDNLPDVQRLNSRQTEIVKDTTTSKFARNNRIVQYDGSKSDSKSITQLIIENSSATIKKGRLFKQGRLVKNWKSRYFVLSVSKLEYFKSPTSTAPQGELCFIGNRCTIRELPALDDIVCKSPPLKASFILELRVADRKMIIACTSSSEKQAWIDAIRLAIDASKTVFHRVNNPNSKPLQSIRDDMDGHPTSGRLSQFSNNAFPLPVVHVTIVAASNLTKAGNSVHAVCEVSLGSDSFKTSIIKVAGKANWKEDNAVSFEAPDESALIEFRIFDHHTFRSSELLSTLTVPIKSLPNMKKVMREFPLVLSSKIPGASITLSLEYKNAEKAYKEDQESKRYDNELLRASVMMDNEMMSKLKLEAQEAADEAAREARRAEEEAKSKAKEAEAKMSAALNVANEERDNAKKEAALAQRIADEREEEARLAREEAAALRDANLVVQQNIDIQKVEENKLQVRYEKYRKFLLDGCSQEEVRQKMIEDGVDEKSIVAFFEGMTSYSQRVQELQEQVDNLSRNRAKKPVLPKQDLLSLMLANNENISTDQAKLLKRLLKLEKQLQQAGITIAEDIPYEEAKENIDKISRRMQEIGSADVTHEDPIIQKQLREEYYRLEQDMEKYNTALMVSDEYTAEQDRKEAEWEQRNGVENLNSLRSIRRMMPIDVKDLSENDLVERKVPFVVARKFKRTNVLQLLRTDPKDILRMHPSLLENLRITGLSIIERRALHLHLADIAEQWKDQQKDEMSARKWTWFKGIKQTFKALVDSYNRHIEQYGPPGNHPYATREDPDVGCPLIGLQCPIKAKDTPPYDLDLGFPSGNVYAASKIQKSDAEDAGAKALREAKELSRSKIANARADALKKHYNCNVREVAKANGACEEIDSIIDKIESLQLGWFIKRLKDPSGSQKNEETDDFLETINEIRLSFLQFAERSGMNLSGKRNQSKDAPDRRSALEVSLCDVVIECLKDMLNGIIDRIKVLKIKEKRLIKAIPSLQELIQELHQKNQASLAALGVTGKNPLLNSRKWKTRKELAAEAKEKAGSNPGQEQGTENPNPTFGTGRGSGRGRGRGSEGGPGDFLTLIRGRSGGGGPAQGDLLAALASRKKE